MNSDSNMSPELKSEKEEKDLCRCCHSEGSYKNLYTPYFWLKDVEKVVYSEMIQECFNIELVKMPKSQAVLSTMCYICIQKLEEAVTFRRQILKCEKLFQEAYKEIASPEPLNQAIKVEKMMTKAKVKQEKMDYEDNNSAESACYIEITNMHSNGSPTDDDDDDGGNYSHDDHSVKDDDDGENSEKNTDNSPDEEGTSLLYKILTMGSDCEYTVNPVKAKRKEETISSRAGKKKKAALKKSQVEREKKKAALKPQVKAEKKIILNKPQVTEDATQNIANGDLEDVSKDTNKVADALADDMEMFQETEGNGEQLEIIRGVSLIKVKTMFIRRNYHYKIDNDIYHCLRCPVVASSPGAIKNHILNNHLNTPKYKCPTCFEPFWEVIALMKHKLQAHNIDDRYKCDICNKPYFGKAKLNEHKKRHKGKMLKCKICSRPAHNKHDLNKHMLCHSDARKYQCQYCSKKFKTRGALTFHERIHEGDKRKVCAECGEAFVQRASLKYHMEKHHPGVEF